jgi:hypothetical protein
MLGFKSPGQKLREARTEKEMQSAALYAITAGVGAIILLIVLAGIAWALLL